MLRIEFERRRRHWRQRDVAAHPDVLAAHPRLRQDDISKTELDRYRPTPSQLEALGRCFGVSPASDLLKPIVLATTWDGDYARILERAQKRLGNRNVERVASPAGFEPAVSAL